MKKLILTSLGFAFLLSLGSGMPVFAAETSAVASDHLALAASYEEKVAAQDALIAEHTQMKQDYKERFYVNDKVTPQDQFLKMDAHCDAIIADAQKLKDELLDFAKWHRMRAAELQGQ